MTREDPVDFRRSSEVCEPKYSDVLPYNGNTSKDGGFKEGKEGHGGGTSLFPVACMEPSRTTVDKMEQGGSSSTRMTSFSSLAPLQLVMRLNMEAMKVLEEGGNDGVACSHQLLLEALRVVQQYTRDGKDFTCQPVPPVSSSAVEPCLSDTGVPLTLGEGSPGREEKFEEAWLLALAMTVSNLGCQLRKANQSTEALSFLYKAKEVEATLYGKPSTSTMLNISAVLLGLGEVQHALDIAKDCLVASSTEDRVLHITALHNYAMILGQIPFDQNDSSPHHYDAAEEKPGTRLLPLSTEGRTAATAAGEEDSRKQQDLHGLRGEAMRVMRQALAESEAYLGKVHSTTKLLGYRCLHPEEWQCLHRSERFSNEVLSNGKKGSLPDVRGVPDRPSFSSSTSFTRIATQQTTAEVENGVEVSPRYEGVLGGVPQDGYTIPFKTDNMTEAAAEKMEIRQSWQRWSNHALPNSESERQRVQPLNSPLPPSQEASAVPATKNIAKMDLKKKSRASPSSEEEKGSSSYSSQRQNLPQGTVRNGKGKTEPTMHQSGSGGVKKKAGPSTAEVAPRGISPSTKPTRRTSSQGVVRSSLSQKRRPSESAEEMGVTWKGRNKPKDRLRGLSQEPKTSIPDDLPLQARKALETLGAPPAAYTVERHTPRRAFPLPSRLPPCALPPEGAVGTTTAGVSDSSPSSPPPFGEGKRLSVGSPTSLLCSPSTPSSLPPLPVPVAAGNALGQLPSPLKAGAPLSAAHPPPLPSSLPSNPSQERPSLSVPALESSVMRSAPLPTSFPRSLSSSHPSLVPPKPSVMNSQSIKTTGEPFVATSSPSSSSRHSAVVEHKTSAPGVLAHPSGACGIPLSSEMAVEEKPSVAFSATSVPAATRSVEGAFASVLLSSIAADHAVRHSSIHPKEGAAMGRCGSTAAGNGVVECPPVSEPVSSERRSLASVITSKEAEEDPNRVSHPMSEERVCEIGYFPPKTKERYAEIPMTAADAMESIELGRTGDKEEERSRIDDAMHESNADHHRKQRSRNSNSDGNTDEKLEGSTRREGDFPQESRKKLLMEPQNVSASLSATYPRSASHSGAHLPATENLEIPEKDKERASTKEGQANKLEYASRKEREGGNDVKVKDSFLRFAGAAEGSTVSSIGVQPFSAITYKDLRRHIRQQAKHNDGRPSSKMEVTSLSATASAPATSKPGRRRASILAQALETPSLNRTPFQKFHFPARRQQRVQEQWKEEDLYRIQRERKQDEKKKQQEFEEQLSAIRCRTENRAASRIQAVWQYWWYNIGKPRREALEKRAAERERMVHLRHVQELTRKQAAQKGDWTVAGLPPPIVVIRCGKKWLARTTAVRYLARRRIPLRGRHESNIQKLLSRLQARVRGMLARARYSRTQTIRHELLLQLQPKEMQEYAAILIQKMFRCHRARKLFSQAYIERYEPPAIKIQEWFRHLLFDHRSRQVDTTTVNRRANAALLIQKTWRGYLGRLRAYMVKLRRSMNECRIQEQNGARLLQRCGRGYVQRKRLGKEALDCCIRRIQAERGREALEEEAARLSNVKERFPEIIVPKNAYEASCLARADEVYRQQQKDREEYDVPLYLEPEARRRQEAWVEAIRFLPFDVRRQRAEEDLRCTLELQTLRRQRAAVKIQRVFRAWRNAKDCGYRNNDYLLICKGIYHQREYERIIQQKEYARQQAKGVALYGDVAGPQRECVDAVRRELKNEQDESLEYVSPSNMRSRGERFEAERRIQHAEEVVQTNLILQEQRKKLVKQKQEG